MSVIACMYLFIINTVSAKTPPLKLSIKQYPDLEYASRKVSISRDIFNANNAFTEKGKTTGEEQARVLTDSNISAINILEGNDFNRDSSRQSQCYKWSETLVYLGTFSNAGQEAVMIQNAQLKTIKVKVGEFIAEQQLTLQEITKTKLITSNSDSSICWLNRLTY